jgi:NAD(P)-dependent dehydrogenase (short-subunit alcohol dehydrogenase family)
MSTRRVLVTGASSGIGRAAAELFAREGARVAMVARRQSALDQAAESLPQSKDRVFTISADVTREADAERCMQKAIDRLGGLDVLVNAAGILKSGDIMQTSLEVWDEMLNVNLRAVFHLMQLAVPHLKESRGNIVNVSSVTGLRSFPGVLAYCVSKAGVDQLTRCAALDLAPFGVRVNAVNPGVVVTSLHSAGGMGADQYQAFLERGKTTHPLGRVGQAQEIAELIVFLASDRAAWITGETVSIDGGRALTCAR